MTAHELARALLAGPDLPVVTSDIESYHDPVVLAVPTVVVVNVCECGHGRSRHEYRWTTASSGEFTACVDCAECKKFKYGSYNAIALEPRAE